MRRFALDSIWRALTGHPLDPGTERELAAVPAVVAALPSLPADGSAGPGGPGLLLGPPPHSMRTGRPRLSPFARSALGAMGLAVGAGGGSGQGAEVTAQDGR